MRWSTHWDRSTSAVGAAKQSDSADDVETVEQLHGRTSVREPQIIADAETRTTGQVGVPSELQRTPDSFERCRRRRGSGTRFLSLCLGGLVRWSGLRRSARGQAAGHEAGAEVPMRGAAPSRLIDG